MSSDRHIRSAELYDGSLFDTLTNSYEETILRNFSQTDMEEDSRCFENYEDMKRSISFDPRDHEPIEQQQISDFKPKDIRLRPPNSLLQNRIQGGYTAKKQLNFICFGDRKIKLRRQEIDDFFNKKRKQDQNFVQQDLKCLDLIESVVRKLCINELKFEPIQIKASSFNFSVIKEDKKEVILNEKPFDQLFSHQNILLTRCPRVLKASQYYKQIQQKKKDYEVIEILSPDDRDLIEAIEKTKSVGELKEKVAGYYYQFIGRMVLVSYSNLKILQNRRKIGDLNDKIIQIYQERPIQYTDRTFVKHNQLSNAFSDCICIVQDDSTQPIRLDEVLINENLVYGKFYLRIEDTRLIQRYSGGIVGYLQSDRTRNRSLLTLTALKIVSLNLFLEFMYKDSTEIVQYLFTKPSQLQEVIKNILAIARTYTHNLETIL